MSLHALYYFYFAFTTTSFANHLRFVYVFSSTRYLICFWVPHKLLFLF
jgi:hypothetical protein